MAKLIGWSNLAETGRAPFGRFSASSFRLFLLSLVVLSVAAAAWPQAAYAKYASFVIDADTGRVLHEANADDRNYPASLTKVMTLYLLFEAIENKRLTWNSRLTTSRHAANQSPTHLALAPGETISVRDAAMALIIHSANDVAVVVAEALGDTEQKFALQMTEKARKLGMSRTTFRNASGLPDRGQQSTARDMAVLAKAMMNRFPQYYSMFSEKSFKFKKRTYRTHNRVVLNYPGADGLKTGYTAASGFNLITTAKRDGHRLIGVVFGGNTSRSRDKHMEDLLDEAFASYRSGGKVVAKNTATKSRAKTAEAETGQATAAKATLAEGDADIPASAIRSDGGNWGIQVGAFYTRTPAQKIAKEVAEKHAKLLNSGEIVIMPLSKSKGRTLYRARIMGLERDTAQEACKVLKRAKQPCLQIKGIGDELAER